MKSSYMKARAGLLMLLIGMISFTGFGATTTDLVQNSSLGIIQPPGQDSIFDEVVNVVDVVKINLDENVSVIIQIVDNTSFIDYDFLLEHNYLSKHLIIGETYMLMTHTGFNPPDHNYNFRTPRDSIRC